MKKLKKILKEYENKVYLTEVSLSKGLSTNFLAPAVYYYYLVKTTVETTSASASIPNENELITILEYICTNDRLTFIISEILLREKEELINLYVWKEKIKNLDVLNDLKSWFEALQRNKNNIFPSGVSIEKSLDNFLAKIEANKNIVSQLNTFSNIIIKTMLEGLKQDSVFMIRKPGFIGEISDIYRFLLPLKMSHLVAIINNTGLENIESITPPPDGNLINLFSKYIGNIPENQIKESYYLIGIKSIFENEIVKKLMREKLYNIIYTNYVQKKSEYLEHLLNVILKKYNIQIKKEKEGEPKQTNIPVP